MDEGEAEIYKMKGDIRHKMLMAMFCGLADRREVVDTLACCSLLGSAFW